MLGKQRVTTSGTRINVYTRSKRVPRTLFHSSVSEYLPRGMRRRISKFIRRDTGALSAGIVILPDSWKLRPRLLPSEKTTESSFRMRTGLGKLLMT